MRDAKNFPKLDEDKHYPEPTWDKSGSERKIVVEVEGLLSSRILVALLHNEFDQIDLVLLPKRIGQPAEQIEQSHGGLWG